MNTRRIKMTDEQEVMFRHKLATMLEDMATLLRRNYASPTINIDGAKATIYATHELSVPPITVQDAEAAYPATRFNEAKRIYAQGSSFGADYYLGIAEYLLDDHADETGSLVVTPELIADFAIDLYENNYLDEESMRIARESIHDFLSETSHPVEYEPYD